MTISKVQTTQSGKRYYRISVYVGKDKPRYTTRWYIESDTWSQKTIDKELAKFANKFEDDCRNGLVESREERKDREARERAEREKIQTLKQYGEKVFMPTLKVTASEHTRDSFQRNLNLHIYPTLGDILLTEITSEQITALLLSLQAPKDKDKKPLKHSSVIKVYTILNMIFKKTYQSRTIANNPMDFVERPKATNAEGKDNKADAYTEKELRYIFKCVDDAPLKWKAYIYLLADTGLRRGEACGLQWKDVDFETDTITIRQTLCYTPSKGVYTNPPKSGKPRKVYPSHDVMGLLRQVRAEQSESTKVINVKTYVSKTGYVFLQEDSTDLPMHPDSPTRYFKRFGNRYGIKDFHPHKLRHSYATIAITAGADVASVSNNLGHADEATTLRMYTHPSEEAQRRAGNIFRQALRETK